MKISEFIKTLQTTKDTVRHYEELLLLIPERTNTYKNYTKKHIIEFQVIQELQEIGFSLKEIQQIFMLKKTLGCSNDRLIEDVLQLLEEKKLLLIQQEQKIHSQQMLISEMINQMKEHNH